MLEFSDKQYNDLLEMILFSAMSVFSFQLGDFRERNRHSRNFYVMLFATLLWPLFGLCFDIYVGIFFFFNTSLFFYVGYYIGSIKRSDKLRTLSFEIREFRNEQNYSSYLFIVKDYLKYLKATVKNKENRVDELNEIISHIEDKTNIMSSNLDIYSADENTRNNIEVELSDLREIINSYIERIDKIQFRR